MQKEDAESFALLGNGDNVETARTRNVLGSVNIAPNTSGDREESVRKDFIT